MDAAAKAKLANIHMYSMWQGTYIRSCATNPVAETMYECKAINQSIFLALLPKGSMSSERMVVVMNPGDATCIRLVLTGDPSYFVTPFGLRAQVGTTKI